MATKLELQQHLNRVTAENVELREKNSVLTTENQFLRTKLSDADIRARKLIAQTNRQHGDSERRAAMQAARELAMKSGRVVKMEA